MKYVSWLLGNMIYWLPFAFATFLSAIALRSRDVGWWPFVLYFPMTFFVVGVVFMVLNGRIRALEKRLDGGERTGGSAGSGKSAGFYEGDGFYLKHDPEGWSRSAVGTLPRFWFMAIFFVAFQICLVYEASEWGWKGGIALALLLGFMQVMFLYALRRLLLRLDGRGSERETRSAA